MAKTPKTGRASIFRGKANGVRYQGIVTSLGARKLEEHRARLRALYRSVKGHDPSVVSDADVIEFLARGDEDTRKYLGG